MNPRRETGNRSFAKGLVSGMLGAVLIAGCAGASARVTVRPDVTAALPQGIDRVLWSAAVDNGVLMVGLAPLSDTKAEPHAVVALVTPDGDIRNRREVAFAASELPTGQRENGRLIVYGGRRLAAFDGDTGRLLWVRDINDATISGVTSTRAGVFATLTNETLLYVPWGRGRGQSWPFTAQRVLTVRRIRGTDYLVSGTTFAAPEQALTVYHIEDGELSEVYSRPMVTSARSAVASDEGFTVSGTGDWATALTWFPWERPIDSPEPEAVQGACWPGAAGLLCWHQDSQVLGIVGTVSYYDGSTPEPRWRTQVTMAGPCSLQGPVSDSYGLLRCSSVDHLLDLETGELVWSAEAASADSGEQICSSLGAGPEDRYELCSDPEDPEDQSVRVLDAERPTRWGLPDGRVP